MYSADKEMGSADESYSLTGCEPKDYYLTETHVESLTESLTQQQFTEQRFLEDVDCDDAALEEMLCNAHREHVYHSQREGLSVGQSSSSVSERTGRPVVERGQELNTEYAQIRTGRMFRWPCKNYLKGTCTKTFCEKWHPSECLFYKTKSGWRFGERCSPG